MPHPALVAAACLLGLSALPASAITLDQAMANPDWIGPRVESPYFSADGQSIYYRLKQDGTQVRDLHRIGVNGSMDVIVDAAAMANADAANAVFDRARKHAAFIRNDDVFVRDLASGALTQVTRSNEAEADVQFSADDHAVQYRIGHDWYSHDLASGVSGPVVTLKAEKDPGESKPDDLANLQQRLFSTLRDIKSNRDAAKTHARNMREGDPTRAPAPIYIGDEVKIESSALAPDARHLLIVTTAKSFEAGKVAKLQHYVTESGYEEQEDERVRVGRNASAPMSLWLLDLDDRELHKLDYAELPGIHDDPLKAVRAENCAARKDSDNAEGMDCKPRSENPERGVTLYTMEFNRDGSQAAVQLRAIDNKDRWIATVEFAKARLRSEHRLTDPAWINWNFNEFGWTPDGRSLWYLSEESGYSHLYLKQPGKRAKALTRGNFEVSSPVLSADGQWFYLRTNAEAPYAYDVYRVASSGGELKRISQGKGLEEFTLSPDGTQIAMRQSSTWIPPQLAVIPAAGGEARTLTDTRKAGYKAINWPKLEIVEVPSSHGKAPIYAKLYKPANFDAGRKYPAVLFVHGAGYLQNTVLGYPNYFREQMFHTLLNDHGYVVLDMDYRASEGYGRDWRTAIYRQMGHPELEDLIDGVNWLAANHSVDAKHVGLYGGSYGGFMSLMAMFRAPEVFAAGAALRPVTDWTSYNHEYTSNILNTPQVDPIAFKRSSPIEFADGLKGGLLIAHGILDDNVFFQDSARLFQRLVELRKDDFEIAPYPLERHGFVHPDSWYDEYRRIFELFERHLKTN